MLNWAAENEVLVWTLTGVSIATFIGTLIALPILIIRMPEEYFVRPPKRAWPSLRQEIRLTLLVLKNVLGAVLLIAGVGMLVLPGQGLLTIFVGIMLLNFPGKRRLELWLIGRKPIYNAANWIRGRRHRPPLLLPVAKSE